MSDAREKYAPGPTLEVEAREIGWGDAIIVRGSGWPDCPVDVRFDGQPLHGMAIAQGRSAREGVQPDARGGFTFRFGTIGLRPGRHQLTARSTHRIASTIDVAIRIIDRREPDPDAPEDPFGRTGHAFRRRFGRLGYIPRGLQRAQWNEVRRLAEASRARAGRNSSSRIVRTLGAPVEGQCNWVPLGPAPALIAGNSDAPLHATAGRVRCLAVDPTNSDIVYAGTANGGVWRTTNSGQTWEPLTDYAECLAIGSLAIDPNKSNRIFAGTGEFHIGVGFLYYPGRGILLSDNGGESWTLVGQEVLQDECVSTIRFDPLDATRLLAASTKGIYEIRHIDKAPEQWFWKLLKSGTARDLVAIALNSTTLRVVAGFHQSGLWSNTRSSGEWLDDGWAIIESGAFPSKVYSLGVAQSKGNPKSLYAAFAFNRAIAKATQDKKGDEIWESVSLPDTESEPASAHTLLLAVHPDDPDIAYYGDVDLWRTENGGKKWKKITKARPQSQSSPHADQNFLAFDPQNPDRIWLANDGGIYLSSDRGDTWRHRNAGLSIFQFVGLASHPIEDAVMFGAGQDVGGLRAASHPAWMHSFHDVDGGFAAIDPHHPIRYYAGYYYELVNRSDDAGVTWEQKIPPTVRRQRF